MQNKFRLYRRPNSMLYAEERGTRHRESLQTKNETEARRLIAARNFKDIPQYRQQARTAAENAMVCRPVSPRR
jgi:hypothetical protein